MNTFTFRTINGGYVSLVKQFLRRKLEYQKVDFPGSGKGIHINKRSRYHLRNVHIIFKKPQEFTGYKVASPQRTKVMNDYIAKETVLFDRGEIDADKMGEISSLPLIFYLLVFTVKVITSSVPLCAPCLGGTPA